MGMLRSSRWTRAPGRWRWPILGLVLASPISGLLIPVAAGIPSTSDSAVADTAGTSLLEWSYDSWTVPWVQLRGDHRILAPAAHATLMVLACETSNLERDRLARHLSAAECEHRMAAIRADQDTAIIFRLDFRVFDFPGAAALVRLEPGVSFVLEDDRGRRWKPVSVTRGPVLGTATGLRLKTVYVYHAPWLRGLEHLYPDQYQASGGRNLTAVEHRVRFARRAWPGGEPVLDSQTRWLRLRVSSGAHEWVATWTFRPEARP